MVEVYVADGKCKVFHNQTMDAVTARIQNGEPPSLLPGQPNCIGAEVWLMVMLAILIA